MKIGIIGASLSGLVAGEKLAKAGHDVTVIEKNRTIGGLLATRYIDGNFFDYGRPFVTAGTDDFQSFIDELAEEGMLAEWSKNFPLFDGSQLHKVNPNRSDDIYYASPNGLNSITDRLKRWVDIKSEEKAGGLTHIGADRGKKRAWMINLTDISVFECDAVIIAAPAPEAYGVLQTAQDETPARRIIRVIDEIFYKPRYVVMASYNNEQPDWKGIECNDKGLSWIGNETSKSDAQSTTNLVVHSSADFVVEHRDKDDEELTRLLLDQASEIADSWIAHPESSSLHFWKYYQAVNPMEEYFMEMEMEEAPLALIGDYFNGNSAEAAYISGLCLADYWIEKFESASVEV